MLGFEESHGLYAANSQLFGIGESVRGFYNHLD